MTTVLVIDDNQDIRENTAEIMELAGYKAHVAENGKRGVELAMKVMPDIIICDIMMPELDGYGVLHLLKRNESTAHIPFIFLTAKTERTDLRKGMEMGADDYVTKPFEELELLRAVEVRLKKAAVLNQTYPSGPAGVDSFLSNIREAGLVDQLADKYEVLDFPKKHILFQEGKRPRYLYYLVSGKVKGFLTHDAGKDYITDLYSAGDFIGHTAIIEEKNYESSAIVLEDAAIMQIPREDFLHMIHSDIGVATKFIQIITRNVAEKETRLLNLAYSSLRKRVAKALVELHQKYASTGRTAALEISREDIAQYVGTATESLIRTLSDFKSEKMLEIREGKIHITDVARLEAVIN